MTRLLFLSALFFFATNLWSQTISGILIDADKKAIAGVNISLSLVDDSVIKQTKTTDDHGKYFFEVVPTGTYTIKTSRTGYSPIQTQPFYFSNNDTTLPPIILQKATIQLAGVVVTAKKPPFENKAGKTVVNVDALPSNTGLNVLEILEKTPGVAVNADGNISVKGKQGVLILIDGKPTYMSGAQLTNLLKSMQSSQLDQIEIMTSPPARYDAAGNSGVINIKTKKNVVKGTNGTATFGYDQGFYPRYNAGINLNYRNDKLNIFGGYNGGHWDGDGTLYIYRKLSQSGSGAFLGTSDQASHRRNLGNYHNTKLGMDYSISKKDVVGFVVNTSFSDRSENQNSESTIFNPDGKINDRLQSKNKNSGNSKNLITNLNYKHSFDSAGRELSFDVDQAYYVNKNFADLSTQVLKPDGSLNGSPVYLRGDIPSTINIYSVKTDYAHPFSKSFKLETGLKASLVNTDNIVVYERDKGNGWQPDETRSNHFIYKENINAAYITLSKSFKSWGLSGGLRAENTHANGRLITQDSVFKRSYINLFPSAGIGYTINDKHQLNLVYNRRVSRPDYDNLNPFVFFLDSLTFSKGNPYLQPQFTNNIELSHTFRKFLTTTINYTITNDIITELLKQDGLLTYQTNENFARQRQLGAAVTANFPVTKWWNLNVYANVYNNVFEGMYNDGQRNYPVKKEVTAFNGNFISAITFAKTWNYELSGWYGKFEEGLLIGDNMGAINTAISKQVFKKKGTVKFGVRDVFATQVFSGYAQYANVDTRVKNVRDTRRFNISFTYKFGKSNIKPIRNRKTGAEEQNRVKSSGS